MTEKFLKLDTSDDAWKALLLPVFGLTFCVWVVVTLLIMGLPVLVIVMVAGIQEGAILSLFAIAASFFVGYLSSMGVFWLLMNKKRGNIAVLCF